MAALAISVNLRRCFQAQADSTSRSVSSSEDEVVDDCSSGDGGSFVDDVVSVSPESYCNSSGSLVQISDDATERVQRIPSTFFSRLLDRVAGRV